MEIKASVKDHKTGNILPVLYRDIDGEKDFEGLKINSIRAYCFIKDQLVVVREAEGYWGLPGGRVEDGEKVREATRREVMEESNMKISKMRFVSIQEVVFPEGPAYHVVRMICLVEPNGDFKTDPAGEVTEIKLIDPSTFIQLSDAHWGKVADRMLERALELKKVLDAEVEFVS